MKGSIKSKILGVTALLMATTGANAANDAAACKSIMYRYSQPNVTLISASVVPADERFPAYCKITGTITIDIGFELRLPLDWNGRFYMVGNEGSGGAISDRNLKRGLILNYAVAATDQGTMALSKAVVTDTTTGKKRSITDFVPFT